MRRSVVLLMIGLATASCRTVGVSHTLGGYSEVAPTVASEMMLDSQQVVVLDVRPAAAFRGPDGHIAGAINAPFETIERQLPELLPYQNQTVLVYGETSTDGEVAAKLLTGLYLPEIGGFRHSDTVVITEDGCRLLTDYPRDLDSLTIPLA